MQAESRASRQLQGGIHLRLVTSPGAVTAAAGTQVLNPSRVLPSAAAALLAVSALLFGTVHPWAYWPVGMATVALAAWILIKGGLEGLSLRWPRMAALILLPVLLQVVPLPRSVLESVAPSNVAAIQSLEIGYSSRAFHPVSIAPSLTFAACGFLLAGALWAGSFSRGLDRVFRVKDFVPPLVGVAVVIALFALIQKATFNGRIYWFWESQFGVATNYFGPFVNRNHFAGWMLLATAVGAGHCVGLLTVAGRSVKNGWRERILWLGTPEASVLTLTLVGVAVMATSLVWSLSRSGVAGAAAAFVVLTLAGLRRARTRTRARLASLAMLTMLASVVAWKGLDTIAASYGDTRTLEWRFDLWRDSLPALREFFVLGSGLNTYGKLMLLYPQTDTLVHAQQAHNDYLQLAIEGGVLVTVFWLLAVGILARRIIRAFAEPQDEQTWWIRMGAVAGICGLALQEVSEFSLQIPGVALLFATVVAVAIHRPAAPQPNAGRSSRPRSRH